MQLIATAGTMSELGGLLPKWREKNMHVLVDG